MKKWVLILCIVYTGFAQQQSQEIIYGISDLDRAIQLFNTERYDEAKPLFKAYLKEHPEDVTVMEYLGDIAGYAKDWDTAITYYERLTTLRPHIADYHYKYGGVLGMKALSISKLRALGLVGDIKDAFLKTIALDPDHIEARWALVEYYIQLPGIIGGSEKKAKAQADELSQISPVDGYLAHGYIAEYSDRPEDAEYNYKEAVKVGGSVNCYTKLYEHYEKQNAPDKALTVLSEAQEVHKDNNRLHYQLGKIAGQYGIGLDQGIACLNRYIEKHSAADGVPKDWAYMRLAQIYRHKKNKQKAQLWITKALADRPDFKEAIKEQERIEAL